MIIFTIFAGRKSCLKLLLRYVQKLLDRGLIHECHVWNYARDHQDESWLRKRFARRPFSWTDPVHAEKARLESCVALRVWRGRIRVGGQIDIRVSEGRIAVQKPTAQEFETKSPWVDFDIRTGPCAVSNTPWYVSCDDPFPIEMHDAMFAWKVPDPVRLFEVRDKGSWSEYYTYYADPRFAHDIIVKCDDDIVFIDPDGFSRLTDVARTSPSCVLPNIVNNGVCAFHQQHAGLLRSDDFGELKLDAAGALWKNAVLCEAVHDRFVATHRDWLRQCAPLPHITLPKGTRMSINMFALAGREWGDVFKNVDAVDDEYELTVKTPQRINRNHVIVQSAVISHLAFYKQREDGLDEPRLIESYHRLADAFLCRTSRIIGECAIALPPAI